MAQTVIGLDIGTWSVKAAVLESGLRSFSLVDFREHHVPRDPTGEAIPGDLPAAIDATLKGLVDRSALATAAPGRRVLTREIELPFADDKRIQSVLAFQLDGQLPKSVDELVYDYYVLQRTEEGAKILCPAVERRWLAEYLGELQQAGTDPRIVTLDTLAYAHIVNHLGLPPSDEPLALVDVGHTTTSVAIVHGGHVQSVRTIARGGHTLTLALMNGLGLDYGQAEHLKHDGVRLDGFTPDGVAPAEHARRVALVQGALQPILRDIRMTLHAHANRFGHRATRAVVFGGSTRMPGVLEAVGAALGVPIEQPRLSKAAWSTVTAERATDLVMPKATGLALRYIGDGPDTRVNFRKDEFAFVSDFKALRDRAVWIAGLVAALLVAFFGRQYIQYTALQKNHTALVAELEHFTGDVLGKPTTDFDAALKRISAPPDTEAESVFPEMSAFRAFYDITAAQESVNRGGPLLGQTERAPGGPLEPPPPDDLGLDDPFDPMADPSARAPEAGAGEAADASRFQIELKQVKIDLKAGFIKGEANNIEAIEAFIARLRTNPCFRQVETSDTQRVSFGNRSDWLRFDVKVTIQCAAPKAADKKATAKAKKAGEDT